MMQNKNNDTPVLPRRFRFFAVLLATFFCFAALLSAADVSSMAAGVASITDPGIQVIIDGQAVVFQSGYGEPFIDENSRTLVPLRGVMEAFGAGVTWNSETRTASVTKDGVTVQVPIGQAYILVGGAEVPIDTKAIIVQSRTYLPIRAVLEAFGAGVSWSSGDKAVIINTNGNDELKAMWISYLELMELPKDQAGFQAAIDTMFDRCAALGMNAVIVHVRSHCDAMYPSGYFPWSRFASGTQGKYPGYDPLTLMIAAAHSRGLAFHAWINPYRVTGYGVTWAQVSSANPAKRWLSDDDPANDRWVLVHNGQYYLNPSVPQVRDLVVSGVREIAANYDVDGIHFDDYFYPALNDSDASLCFDKPEYEASGSAISIAEWRRENVNLLIRAVYASVKAENPGLVFGVSPAGNADNLRSNSSYFVDIDTWLSCPGYIDYIMPQLYWGFERKDSSGNPAPYAFEKNLNTWIDLAARGNATLYIGLNMANAGTDVMDNNPVSEWLRYDDIIARQVLAARAAGVVDGFAFFRYAMFDRDQAQKETANLESIL